MMVRGRKSSSSKAVANRGRVMAWCYLALLQSKATTCRGFFTGSRISGRIHTLATTKFVPIFLVSTTSSTDDAPGTTSTTRLFSTATTTALEENEELQKESSSSSSSYYSDLIQKLETITQLERASAVLSYDQLVFMPQGDATSIERGAQMAALASVIHEKKTDPKLLDLIKGAMKEIEDDKDDTDDKPYKVRLLELEHKSFIQNERIPTVLASKAAELTSSAYGAWVKARQAKDFDAFAPVLTDCFQTAMDIAKAKRGENDDIDLYTQMLDEFEMGMAQPRIDAIFTEIQDALVPLIGKVLQSDTPPSTLPIQEENRIFPLDQQQKLNQRIVKAIGFNEDMGRIDVSVHPFTTSFSPKDVRITSRFRDDEWYQGLAGTIHEGGHAIYEQNLPDTAALNINGALSMGAHESQSLFWERHVGLSEPFWKWATPLLQETFEGYNYTPEEVYGAVNAVSQSLIRVEADELTYPLHVILRYNIEKDVIAGKLAVTDIPKRWNQEMKDLLQIDVPSDDKGCLQDVHWSGLAFGYFPTYLIGSATAAQLAHYCHVDIPNMDELLERGEFTPIKEWLTEKVHVHGRRYPSLDAMLEDQLGEPLNPKYFIDYLTQKYTKLYRL